MVLNGKKDSSDRERDVALWFLLERKIALTERETLLSGALERKIALTERETLPSGAYWKGR